MVSKTGLHAVKALAVLANLPSDQYMGAVAVAEAIGAPRNYLGKLLQTLARAGLVEGQKGMNGGFRLARPAERITLFDVIDPIDHVVRWNGCFLGRASCGGEGGGCAVHQKWGRARDEYMSFLKTTTIEELRETEGR